VRPATGSSGRLRAANSLAARVAGGCAPICSFRRRTTPGGH